MIANWGCSFWVAKGVANYCERFASEAITFGAVYAAATVAWHIGFQGCMFASKDLKPLLAKPIGEKLPYLKKVLPDYWKPSLVIETLWLASFLGASTALYVGTSLGGGASAAIANLGLNIPFNLLIVPLVYQFKSPGLNGVLHDGKRLKNEIVSAFQWTARKYFLGLPGDIMTRMSGGYRRDR